MPVVSTETTPHTEDLNCSSSGYESSSNSSYSSNLLSPTTSPVKLEVEENNLKS